MKGLNESLAAIADWHLHNVCIRTNVQYAIRHYLISLNRRQATLKGIYRYNNFHRLCALKYAHLYFLNYFNNCGKFNDFVAKMSNFTLSFNMFYDMTDLFLLNVFDYI